MGFCRDISPLAVQPDQFNQVGRPPDMAKKHKTKLSSGSLLPPNSRNLLHSHHNVFIAAAAAATVAACDACEPAGNARVTTTTTATEKINNSINNYNMLRNIFFND